MLALIILGAAVMSAAWALLSQAAMETRHAGVALVLVAWVFLAVGAVAGHYGNSETASECAKVQPSSSWVTPTLHSLNSVRSIVFVTPLVEGAQANRAQ